MLPDAAWVPVFLAQFDALRTAIIQGATYVRQCTTLASHKNTHHSPDSPASVSALLECARVDGDETAPTTHLLQGLDHLATLRMLRYCVDRLETSSDICTLQAQWLFALLARLELPVDPDTGALLQQLQRRLTQLRAGVSGRHDPRLPPINVLLVVVGARFGQDQSLAPLYGS